jgi:hypothetical protein
MEGGFCCISQRGRGVYKCSFSPDVLPDVDERERVANHVIKVYYVIEGMEICISLIKE